jgi:diadenylate cyclase
MSDIKSIFNLAFWDQIIQNNLTPYRVIIAILDIAIVTFFIYKVIGYVKGTKLMTLFRGVLLFIVVRIIAGLLDLTTVEWLMNQVITYGVIAAVVIFQPEIRRALESLGRSTNLIATLDKSSSDDGYYIAEYEKAIDYMSKRKIGALIAIERTQSLQEYISTGTPLDAKISSGLLINIFIPNTPLHDGAVIVSGNRIAVTSAYLPLSESTSISKAFGTRHRAAIGLAEVSDALTIVVSEETGGVSVTENGEFYKELTKEQLHAILVKGLSDKTSQAKGRD